MPERSTKSSTFKVEPVNLVAVIETALDAVHSTAEAIAIDFDIELEALPGPIWGDSTRLSQVVWNLLSNAFKFTPRAEKVSVRLSGGATWAELTVSDTGQGIRAEFLPYIFERFQQADSTSTRQHGGLGLGLSIVHHLVKLHGGTIEASSPGEGQGATFRVRLPVHALQFEPQEPVPVPTSAPGEPEVRIEGLRVLVVEDESDTRAFVATVLQQSGAAVTAVASAREAMAAIEEAEVLVSDIGMPGEDGYALIRKIRSLGLTLPAVALTAYARSEDRTQALLAGFQMHVPKPIEPTELVAVVASLAEQRPR